MALIYETENFVVESYETPHVDRNDGGNIRILPKVPVSDRTKLSPQHAIELMRLTMVVGEAMEKGLKKRELDIVKINYQDMGNWAFKTGKNPVLHIHVYGRTRDAKYQIFPEAVQLPDRSTGFYNNFKPLGEGDVKEIRNEIERIFQEEKYQDKNWHL